MKALNKLPYRIKYQGNYYGLTIYKTPKTWVIEYVGVFKTSYYIHTVESKKLKKAVKKVLNKLNKSN